MKLEISCPRCGETERQIKQGKTESGSQRYLCKGCRKVYTPEPKKREYSEDVRRKAIELYFEGNSGLAVSRILGISKNLCLYWVKKYTKELKQEEDLSGCFEGAKAKEKEA